MVRHLEHPEIPIPYEGKRPRIEPRMGLALTKERRGTGVGTRWSYTYRGKEYIWDDVVSEWVEEGKIAWTATKGMKMNDYFLLTPNGSDTSLLYHISYKAPYGLLGTINERLFFRSAVIENIEWTLKALKDNAERLATLPLTNQDNYAER